MKSPGSVSSAPPRAVLFDAGNTLVFLDHVRMAERVGTALGLPLTADKLAAGASEAALVMERASGTDRDRATAYLEALFRLAGVPVERLGEVRACLAGMHRERNLWCSVEDGTVQALDRLRAAGIRLGVVSNSDGRVDEALRAAGLRDFFDVVIDSSVVGIEKPDPRIFHAALAALNVRPEEALYVGDLYEVDVVGARAAGIEAVLLTRSNPDHSRHVASLGAGSCRCAASIDELVNSLLPQETTMSTESESR